MPRALRLLDLSDRELLGVIVDVADPTTGFAASEEIAKRLRLSHDRPTQCVGARCSYLAREMAVLERNPDHRREWRVTARGEAFLNGHLRVGAERALQELDESQLPVATRLIAQRQRREAGRAGGKMARREWQRETYRGPR